MTCPGTFPAPRPSSLPILPRRADRTCSLASSHDSERNKAVCSQSHSQASVSLGMRLREKYIYSNSQYVFPPHIIFQSSLSLPSLPLSFPPPPPSRLLSLSYPLLPSSYFFTFPPLSPSLSVPTLSHLLPPPLPGQRYGVHVGAQRTPRWLPALRTRPQRYGGQKIGSGTSIIVCSGSFVLVWSMDVPSTSRQGAHIILPHTLPPYPVSPPSMGTQWQ